MFYEWLRGNNENFKKLREKFKSLEKDDDKSHVKSFTYVDPSEREKLSTTFKDLIFDIEFNKTHQLHMVVPDDLQDALFDGWNSHGMDFVRILNIYGEFMRRGVTLPPTRK